MLRLVFASDLETVLVIHQKIGLGRIIYLMVHMKHRIEESLPDIADIALLTCECVDVVRVTQIYFFGFDQPFKPFCLLIQQ